MKKILYNYRITDSSISRVHGKAQALFAKKARKFYLERLRFKKDSYDDFNPEKLIRLAREYKGYTPFDYFSIIILLESNNTLARKRIISMIIKNKRISLRLIKYFIKTFIH